MLLYHYSNEDLTIIDPKHFGSSHTPFSEIPRSYYYVNPDYKEKFFLGARFRYTVNVKVSKIYDAYLDELRIFSGLPIERNLNKLLTIDDVLRELKKRGYTGFLFRTESNHDVVALFYAVKPIAKETL